MLRMDKQKVHASRLPCEAGAEKALGCTVLDTKTVIPVCETSSTATYMETIILPISPMRLIAGVKHVPPSLRMSASQNAFFMKIEYRKFYLKRIDSFRTPLAQTPSLTAAANKSRAGIRVAI
jgi:hypothetical protein